MSLEQAINAHAEAMLELAAAIHSAAGGASEAPAAKASKPAAKADPKETKEEAGPIYWASADSDEYGKVESEAEFKKLKKSDDSIFKIPESMYEDKIAAAKQKEADNKAAAKSKAKVEEAEKEEKPAAKSKAKAKPAVEEDDEDEVTVTKDDLIATFQKFLSKDLDAETRDERAAFVKPILKHFGAAKVSELDSQHYATAVKLVELKLAGHDIDPSDEDFDPVAIIADALGEEDDSLV